MGDGFWSVSAAPLLTPPSIVIHRCFVGGSLDRAGNRTPAPEIAPKMRPLKQKLTIKKPKMRPLRQKWFAGPGPTGSPDNQFLLQGTHFRRIFALRVRIFAACWLKTTSKMQPLLQKYTPCPLGASEIQPLRQRGRRKCDPFCRKCTPDPLGTTKMNPLRQKMSSHAQIHPREAICPLSGRNGFQTRRNRSFFTCIGMPPEHRKLGP